MIPALIAAGTAAAGIISGLMQNGEHEKARRLLERARDEFGKIDPIKLQEVVAVEFGPSALEQVQADPKLREVENEGLNVLKEMMAEGGFTLSEKAAQERALARSAVQERAQRGALAENFAARGQLGSGAQLTMSLANQQNAAEQAADIGLQTAADARRRYFEANAARTRQAADMSDRDLAQKNRLAAARDQINQANAQARRQQILDNNAVATTRYNAALQKANGMAGQTAQLATSISENANRQAAQNAGIIEGVGEAATWAYDEYGRRKKK